MSRTFWRRALSCIVGVGLVSLAIPVLTRTFAADKPPAANPNPQPPANVVKFDRPKLVIEAAPKRLLANQTGPAVPAAKGDFVNPKVEPGKVRWHADFAAACRAARKSGKPVLLFQMMGKLDDQFC